jgi:copper chaperone NosL
MKPLHRILMALGAVALLGLFFFPMWSITLEAPQYPKGSELGINIHINNVEGSRPNDLDNINNLNHYIGMKRIEPDSIPELKYMPVIVLVLVGLGLLVAAFGKRWMILVWLGLLTGAGTLGMYDFWLWEYDYGHNLDPHAIIKIEGMSYQPPLFGTEQLLNFTASSYPAIGFAFIALGGLLAVVAWWLSRQPKTSHT